MSSFFTAPGSQKKRKRSETPQVLKKRAVVGKTSIKADPNGAVFATKQVNRDESISGSDYEDSESYERNSSAGDNESENESDEEEETAAERRLRLAERYLENVKEHVDEAGFDAADIDRDLIAERLQEDIAETKGRVYRQLAAELDFTKVSQTFFRTNTNTVTSISSCAPYFYTTTKDLYLHKWRAQDLPRDQFPQTTRRPSQKSRAPPRKKPVLESWTRGNAAKKLERDFKKHTGRILAVAASPNGQYVVSGGEDRKIIVYDASTLKPIKVLSQHRDSVTGLAFRRGTNQLYSCSKDRTVKVWSLDEMAYVETLFGHQDEIVDIDALAQERCVSVGARDRTARLWKVMEETQLVFRGGSTDKKKHHNIDSRSLLNEGSVDRIAMIDDDLFVTGSDNGSIALWSVQKKKPVYIEPIAHGVDPKLDPSDASAELHPLITAIPAPTPRWITALRTIPYSDVILSGSWDGHVRVWRLSEDKRRIDQVCALGGLEAEDELRLPEEGEREISRKPIVGIINDITVFERGDRGQDGICVIAAVSKEHRFGRWKVSKAARNGGVVLEIPKLQRAQLTNGHHLGSSDLDKEE